MTKFEVIKDAVLQAFANYSFSMNMRRRVVRTL